MAEHSCSRHGVVAAKQTSSRAGSFYTCFKNIYCTASRVIATVTMDVFGKDRNHLLVGVCSVLPFLTPAPTASSMYGTLHGVMYRRLEASVLLRDTLDVTRVRQTPFVNSCPSDCDVGSATKPFLEFSWNSVKFKWNYWENAKFVKIVSVTAVLKNLTEFLFALSTFFLNQIGWNLV